MTIHDQILHSSLQRQRLDDTLKRWSDQVVPLWLGVCIGVASLFPMVGLVTQEGYEAWREALPTFPFGIGIICAFVIWNRRGEQIHMVEGLRKLEKEIDALEGQ
jgi:hypothetical protein